MAGLVIALSENTCFPVEISDSFLADIGLLRRGETPLACLPPLLGPSESVTSRAIDHTVFPGSVL